MWDNRVNEPSAEQHAGPIVGRVVSGGQTGVDRGALDAAMALGIEHGGWCPKGRLAEDGFIPTRYRMKQTASTEYWVRTERNVRDSDGTLILYREQLSGGTDLTRRLAEKHGKPHLPIDLAGRPDAASVRRWIAEHQIDTLNVAGPRESSAPEIQWDAKCFLEEALG